MPRRPGRAALSPRERDVLQLVASGLTNPQISSQLGLGVETVKTLLERVFRKLGVQWANRGHRRGRTVGTAVSGLDPAARAALLAMFLDDAPRRLQRIVDGHDAEREAHTLAGGAATAGLEHVEALARALESALEDGDEEDAARALDRLRAELDAAGARPHGTVLCIEDDPTSRLLIERIVARRPRMTLATAATGEEGLALAFANPPDVVLLDLRLPDLPGGEVLRRLKGRPATAGSRVIVLSAEAHALRRDELLAAGADDYLTKPIDVGQLLAILDDAVDR